MSPSLGNDEELIDPREIDKVISETAGMAGRWSLFRKFLLERLQVRFTTICHFVIQVLSNVKGRRI
jgi:hypothetical protein